MKDIHIKKEMLTNRKQADVAEDVHLAKIFSQHKLDQCNRTEEMLESFQIFHHTNLKKYF